jgi:hypothetical protein
MKQILIPLLILKSISTTAQQNDTGIPIPIKNGVIFYEQSYQLNHSVKKEEFYKQVAKWFKHHFPVQKNQSEQTGRWAIHQEKESLK